MSKKVSISPRPQTESQNDEWVQSRIQSEEGSTRVKPKRLTIELHPDLHRELKIHCAKNDIQIAEFLRSIIRLGLGAE